MDIQRRSYFNPSQKEGNISTIFSGEGLKNITVAIRKAVNINKYIKNSLTSHCMVLGTRHCVNLFLC